MEVPGVTLLGVPKLDADHLQLARIIEELSRLNEANATRYSVEVTMRELVDHTRSHFAAEEQLMLNDGYPQLATHRDKHVKLLELIESIARDLADGQFELDDDLMSTLWVWVNHHIKTADREYADFLRPHSAGSAVSP